MKLISSASANLIYDEHNLTVSIETIDADLAKLYLSTSPVNRKTSEVWVKVLSEVMQRGEWRLNGETIILDESDRLMQGHHRMAAIAACDIPQDMLVVRGVPRSVFDTLDFVMKRSAANVLEIKVMPNATRLAAAARSVVCLIANSFGVKVSPTQVEQVIEDFPQLVDLTCAYSGGKIRTFGRSSWIGALTLAAEKHGMEKPLQFIDLLSRGEGLGKGHPALVLRERMLMETRFKKRMQETVSAAFFVQAWNAFIRGRQLSLLRFREGDAFPQIR